MLDISLFKDLIIYATSNNAEQEWFKMEKMPIQVTNKQLIIKLLKRIYLSFI